MSKHIIMGRPGTGKTFSLINTIQDNMNQGISPSNICFCTFSKSAADEAKNRTISKFNLDKKDLPFFGTIHALCFRRFCLDKKVIRSKNKDYFFKTQGVEYQGNNGDDDLLTNENFSKEDGNLILEFYDKIRVNFCKNIFEFSKEDLRKVFYKIPIDEENYEKLFVNSFDLHSILISYEEYKLQNEFVDFIDMLLIAYKSDYIIPTEVLIVDEFQDLSPLQCEIYRQWSKGKKEIYIAGDDDQTIYKFICANSEFLLNEIDSLDFEKGDTKKILSKTYRMYSNINDYCDKYISKHIKGRREPKISDCFKEGGEIEEDYIDGDLDKVLDYIRKDKFTYILFRTNYYKRSFIEEVLVPRGIIYYEMKGQSIWNQRTINLFNGVYNLINKNSLNYNEVKYLIESIPFKLGLLKRGLKSHFKDLTPREDYNLSDLINLGFDMKIFSLLDYEKLFNILKLNDNIKQSFYETQKKIITLPIRLKLGTIHSSKGKEADDVIIFKDVPTKVSNSANKSSNSWDDEIRVFYVGQSRAKERLVILRGGFRYSDADLIP